MLVFPQVLPVTEMYTLLENTDPEADIHEQREQVRCEVIIYGTTFSRPLSKGLGPWMHSHFEDSNSCFTAGLGLSVTSFMLYIKHLEEGRSSPALKAACQLNCKG